MVKLEQNYRWGNSFEYSESKKKNKESFDFDEALNPTESLADIMKDLV